ncbi:hypothetical protein CI610_03171 [invertebrate metagenome]|uniref:Uncharacterized protein n=1 Tax=invertebrate metagenome TaxID=1711999 RepID=A0A2H9T3W3_9ZZZZ
MIHVTAKIAKRPLGNLWHFGSFGKINDPLFLINDPLFLVVAVQKTVEAFQMMIFVFQLRWEDQLFSVGVAQTTLITEANFFKVATLFITVFKGGKDHHRLTAGEHSVDGMLDYRPQGIYLL